MNPLAEVIIFPAVEPVGIRRLASELFLRDDTALVTDTIPSPDRPPRLIKVTAAGLSSRPSMVTAIRSNIYECWDDDRDRAANLAELAYAIIMATTGVQIDDAYVRYAVSVGEPVFFPDPATTLPRYQFTCSFALAGRAI